MISTNGRLSSPSPTLVIFDCDGVLIDSEVLAHQALVDELAVCGIFLSCEEALRQYVGLTLTSEKAEIEKQYGITLPPDFFDKRTARLTRLFEEKLKPIPGIADFVDALPFKKCVASGSRLKRLRHSLGLTGLWDRFAPHVFSVEQVQRSKPAPDIFLFAASQMGVAPMSCLVIEDSIAGVRAAKAAGMRAFGFVGGSHCREGHADVLRQEGAEKVFSKMADIAEVLI